MYNHNCAQHDALLLLESVYNTAEIKITYNVYMGNVASNKRRLTKIMHEMEISNTNSLYDKTHHKI